MKKQIVILIGTVLTLAMITGCGSTKETLDSTPPQNSASAETAVESVQSVVEESSAVEDTSATEKVFTIEELGTYDGQNGQPAYVAVDGVVYDVSAVAAWEGGTHKNGLTAGKDLTDEITNQSPHGLAVLENLPVVGSLS